jgi:hypothetical protein
LKTRCTTLVLENALHHTRANAELAADLEDTAIASARVTAPA